MSAMRIVGPTGKHVERVICTGLICLFAITLLAGCSNDPSPNKTVGPVPTDNPAAPAPFSTAGPDPTAAPAPAPTGTAGPDPTAAPAPAPTGTAGPDPTAAPATAPAPAPTGTAGPDPTAAPATAPAPAPTGTAGPDPTAAAAPAPAPTGTSSAKSASDQTLTNTFISVSAGGEHSCGVKTAGLVGCWGNNITGQASPPDGSFVSVSAGVENSCGVRNDSKVECWGRDRYGLLAPPGGAFTSVSLGRAHGCGVKTDGLVECWGLNEDGQATPPEGSFASVSAGSFHTCGVMTDGSVNCWGFNEDGTGNFVGQATPPEGSFASVSAGGFHTCGVMTDGSVQCWGFNEDGRKNLAGQATPPEGSFASVSAGNFHTCGVRTGGTVVCWGSNQTTLGNSPVGQATPPEGTFTSVSAGGDHTCGVKIDGVVQCWGDNGDGQAPQDDDHSDQPLGAVEIEVEESVSAALEYLGDIDYFRFRADARGVYLIRSIGRVGVDHFDVSGQKLPPGTSGLAGQIDWKAERAGEYYIRVSGGTGEYTLTVTSVSDDHGDSAQESSDITIGETITGSLDYHGDADYFRFRAEAGQAYSIEMDPGMLKRPMLDLLDSDGRERWFVDRRTEDHAIDWQAGVTEENYVRVASAFGNEIGTYTLTVAVR